MKRTAVLSVFCLGAAFLLTGCGEEEESSSAEPRRFTTTFVSYMDTAVNFTAYCDTSGDFDRAAQIVADTLAEADRLYDRYDEKSAPVRPQSGGAGRSSPSRNPCPACSVPAGSGRTRRRDLPRDGKDRGCVAGSPENPSPA